MSKTDKIRLDNLLVERGHYKSRAKARDAINRGCIQVDGNKVTKPGATFSSAINIEIEDEALEYVSRAALKLLSGLEKSAFDPAEKLCVDIGASTGGFTQVLVERNASHVYAIDVGHGQMVERISSFTNVTNIEGLNARDLQADHLDNLSVQFIVSDVSFISLKLALPPVLALAEAKCQGIFLVKPQFEVGRKEIGKGGIVRNPKITKTVVEEIANWFTAQGWRIVGIYDSPISGGDGNREYLLAAQKEVPIG